MTVTLWRCHTEYLTAVVADVPLLVFQGVTVEQVCRELRSLYVVRNLSSSVSSVSMTCELSLSANNEIHVAIVSHVCSERQSLLFTEQTHEAASADLTAAHFQYITLTFTKVWNHNTEIRAATVSLLQPETLSASREPEEFGWKWKICQDLLCCMNQWLEGTSR